MKILLDTSAAIELLDGSKRGEKVLESIEAADAVFTTVLNVFEVRYVLEDLYGQQKAELLSAKFIEKAKIAEISVQACLQAAELKLSRRSLSAVDCNSYAAALAHGFTFITTDSGFKGMKGTILL